MAEALGALRDAVMQGLSILLFDKDGVRVGSVKEASSISFSGDESDSSLVFSKSAKTAYTANPETTTDTYDLGTLVVNWLCKDESFGEYAKSANENGVGIVSFTDRRSVHDFLKGVTGFDNNPRIIGSTMTTTVTPAKRALEPAVTTAPDAPAATIATTATETDTSNSTAKKQRYTVNKEDVERCKRIEKFIQGPPYGYQGMSLSAKLDRQAVVAPNRETILRGDRINSFESVKAMVKARMRILADEQKARSSMPSASTSSAVQSQPQQQRRKRVDPIIIISPSSTALINMYNVKRFLEESVFEHAEQARLNPDGTPRQVEDVIPISHTRASASTSGASGGVVTGAGRMERYFVVDNVDSLEKLAGKDAGNKDAVWDRVVCVFTTGQEWQFKAYKWKTPKEIFHHVKGVHAQWTTDPPNEKVRSWNVTELRVDPSKRHIDKSTVANFWRELEGWIAMRKPWMQS